MSRASLHERYADHLEETTEEESAENEEIVGYHLAQACDYRSQLGPADEDHGALAARASSRLAVGGRRALARGDHLGAVKLLTRATGLLAPGDAHRTIVLPDLGEGLVRLGSFDDAEKVLLEAIEFASDSGDEATRWRSVLELCDARFFSDPGASYKQVLAEVDQAMRWFESADDDLGLARAYWILAGAHFVTGRAGAADEYLVRAIEHARRGGSLRLVGRLLTSLSGALIDGPCPAQDGIVRLNQALPDLEENRLGRAVTLLRIGTFHAMTGEFDEGRSLIGEGRDILRDLGGTLLGTMVTAWEAAHLERLAGEDAAARAHLLEGFAELKKIGDKAYLPTLAAMLAHVLCSLERFEEADEVASLSEREAATNDMVSQILWRGARAKLLAHAGDMVAAKELASEATRIAEGTDFLEIMADALMDEAEIAGAAGDPTGSSDAARRALALYERKGNEVSTGRARVVAKLTTSAERNQ